MSKKGNLDIFDEKISEKSEKKVGMVHIMDV